MLKNINLIGRMYFPSDNSYIINCRTGRSAWLVPKNPSDIYYTGPNPEEKNASFEIVAEPYEESVMELSLGLAFTHTFINVKSHNTGNIYRVLYNEHCVL